MKGYKDRTRIRGPTVKAELNDGAATGLSDMLAVCHRRIKRVLPRLNHHQMIPLGGATENPIKLIGMFSVAEVGCSSCHKPGELKLEPEHLIG